MAETLENVPGKKRPENMTRKVGHSITVAAIGLPATVLAIIGFTVGNSNTAAGLMLVWFGVFVFASLRFQRKTTFLVVERFGKFWDVKYAGPRIVIPFIDNPILRDDFLQKDVRLFVRRERVVKDGRTIVEEKPIQIDFIGASTPVDSSAYYQVGDPNDIKDGLLQERVTEQILKYTYTIRDEDKASRIAELFEGSFRARLEGKELPAAQAEMEQLAADGVNAARDALKEIGVYPFPNKGIIVRDIDLPEELVKFREQATRGEADAKEAVNRSKGYWQPLTKMKEGLRAAGINLSDEQVSALFMQQKGLETVLGTKANISFVAPGMNSVLQTLSVGTTNQPVAPATPIGGTS